MRDGHPGQAYGTGLALNDGVSRLDPYPRLSDNLTIASCVGVDTSDERSLADVFGIGTKIVHALANDVVLQNSAYCLICSGNDRIRCSRGGK